VEVLLTHDNDKAAIQVDSILDVQTLVVCCTSENNEKVHTNVDPKLNFHVWGPSYELQFDGQSAW
jgi:hypothetical protein